MKNGLLALVFKLCHRMGFYPQRIFPPKETYWNLLNYPQEVRAYLLKRITYFIRIENNQTYYKDLLKAYVPNWDIEIKKSSFVGFGQGENCLNTYRKVSIRGRDHLEKVYFSSGRDLKVLEWFQENVYFNLKGKIKIPAIDYIFRSKELSIVYFEFLNLKPLPHKDVKKELIRLSHELYLYSINLPTKGFIENVPDWLKDHRNYFMYRRNFDFARNGLQEKGVDIDVFENQVLNSKYVLTHGDLWCFNIFADSTLIDWDACGVYPIGMDPAFIYYRFLYENREKGIYFLNWLSSHYRTVVLENDWKDFERNFCYFLFIFVYRLPQNKFGNIKKELFVFLTQTLTHEDIRHRSNL